MVYTGNLGPFSFVDEVTNIAPVAEILKQASLEPKFWQDVFHQQLGVLSLNGLKHAQCQLNLHLLQFARNISEKIAVQKFLLSTNEEITFTPQGS